MTPGTTIREALLELVKEDLLERTEMEFFLELIALEYVVPKGGKI